MQIIPQMLEDLSQRRSMLLRGCKKLIPNLEIALDTLRADESIANAIHFTKEGDTTQSPLVNSVYKLLENDISQMEESLSQLSCAQKHYIQGITILSPRLQNMNVMFKRPADDLLTTIPECSNEPLHMQVTQLP